MSLTQALFGKARRGGAAPGKQAAQAAQLGTALVALRLHGDVPLPPGCVELVFSAGGHARRAPASRAGRDEIATAYHPGPYETAFAPFAGAPEIGLRLRYVADAADPRVAQQRFDLYLFSEAGPELTVACLHGAVAAAVRDALAQDMLDLPACTTLAEWHAFRAGLNELLYTRFGLTVDDCVPVDLGAACDYAAQLRARQPRVAAAAGIVGDVAGGIPQSAANVSLAASLPQPAANVTLTASLPEPAANVSPTTASPEPATNVSPAAALLNPAVDDAHALRRLFLELPAWSAAVRALDLPPACSVARRDLLQCCALAALDVNTMPALAWAAPDRPLALPLQAPRAAHSVAAAQALDQAWALLARWRLAAQRADSDGQAALLDEAARLAANIAFHLAGRRAVHSAAAGDGQRKEPQL